MMTFVIMTLSFTLAILLAGGLTAFIVTRPKVMKAYMNWALKLMDQMDADFFGETKDL